MKILILRKLQNSKKNSKNKTILGIRILLNTDPGPINKKSASLVVVLPAVLIQSWILIFLLIDSFIVSSQSWMHHMNDINQC